MAGLRRYALGAIMLATCAAGPVRAHELADPLEPLNRAMFALNLRAYDHVLVPAARYYRDATTAAEREAIRHFLTNLRAPVVAANQLLQGDRERAEITLRRFAINSTAGLTWACSTPRPTGATRHRRPKISARHWPPMECRPDPISCCRWWARQRRAMRSAGSGTIWRSTLISIRRRSICFWVPGGQRCRAGPRTPRRRTRRQSRSLRRHALGLCATPGGGDPRRAPVRRPELRRHFPGVAVGRAVVASYGR